MTLNGPNTLLKKGRGWQGLTTYSNHASRNHHSNVLSFVKAFEFCGEIVLKK